MENENKDFQGVENEETLTPEEKVQADIRSKVADAAAEVQDEIEAAAAPEEAYDASDADAVAADESAEGYEAADEPAGYYDENGEFIPYEEGEFPEADAAPAPEPVKVTLTRSSFIWSLICSALVGALVLLFGLQVPKWIEAIPEGSTVATVNGEEITDLDVNYYIYAQAATYAQQNGASSLEDLAAYDWNQEVDGRPLADIIKEKAVQDAVNEVLLIQKGEENDAVLDDDEKQQVSSQVAGIKASYGEDGFTVRARSMGISSIKQYEKMLTKVMTVQKVQDDLAENPDKYYPEDKSVLNDYLQPENATVKHILIKNDTAAPAEGEEAAAPAEDKKALAESVLQRAQSGEDFDALVEEFNEDPGATEEGYTFGKGEMDPAFEEASFALKLDEISGLVESSYGYHIIKRIPGQNELQAYWQANGSKVKIKNRKLAKLDVAAVMADVMAATDELNAEEEAAQASAE